MSIKIENVQINGWESALRGMRNPMNSWDKADTDYEEVFITKPFGVPAVKIGENDLGLMKRLSNAGTDHAKYERFIDVTCDITAPLYWWKEFDTYRMGVEKNSCSTMHKIQAKEFTLDDFSCSHLKGGRLDCFLNTIENLNEARTAFLETKDKEYWWQMIQLLPSSYNQKRTCKISYQALKNMYLARRNHKLDEWKIFCTWAEELPYFNDIVGDLPESE